MGCALVYTCILLWLNIVDESRYLARISRGQWLQKTTPLTSGLKHSCSSLLKAHHQHSQSKAAKASTLKDANPPSGQSHCRDYATMWNGIWRQRQESKTSVWRTHLTSTSLFDAHSSKPLTYGLADADLCKHTRKRVSVTYKHTIRYSCADSATNLLPNANNTQQGHFLEQQRRTMVSLSRLCFTWYSPKAHCAPKLHHASTTKCQLYNSNYFQ